MHFSFAFILKASLNYITKSITYQCTIKASKINVFINWVTCLKDRFITNNDESLFKRKN